MAKAKYRKENSFSGGVNQGVGVFALNKDDSLQEVGFDTDEYPYAAVAKGRVAYGASGGAATQLMTVFKETHLIRAVGTKLQYDNAGTWTDIGTFTSANWDATMFEVSGNKALILTNGTDEVKYTINGTTVANLNAGVAPKGSFVCTDSVRLWIAKGDILYWSKFLDATDWTAAENSGSVQYYTERGGDITGLKNFYGDKYIWKKDSMAVIQGTSYFNYRLQEISNDVGCVSARTIQEVGDTLFWLGRTDVYAFKGGFPIPIGQRIRDYLNRVNVAYLDKCAALTDGIRYYLCLVIDNATEPNIRLVFDPRYNIWRVCAMNENYRYAVRFNEVTYVGDSSGQTYKFNTGTTNNGAAISWSIDMGPYDEDYPEAEKIYTEIHLQGKFPTGTTMALAVSTTEEGEDFTEVNYNLMTDPTAQNGNIQIPFDTVPLTHWMRYRLSGTGPVTLYKVQRYYRLAAVQK